MSKIKLFLLVGTLSTSVLLLGLKSSDSLAQHSSWQNYQADGFNKDDEKSDKPEKERKGPHKEEKSDKPEKDKKGPKGPPPEAIDACQGKGEGESCSFEGKHGKVEGTCKTRHETMRCVPDKKKGRPDKSEKPKHDKPE
jgi:hypothetical protein